MSKSKLNQFQQDAYATSSRKIDLHGRVDVLVMAALGLAGEGGEFVDNVKKIAYHGHELTPETRTKMAKELGDVMWYVAVAALGLDYELEQITDMVINKLKERYPEGKFSSERSKNRKEEESTPADTSKVDVGGMHFDKPVFDRAAAEQAAEREAVQQDAFKENPFNARGF